jgi:hypothetical protein
MHAFGRLSPQGLRLSDLESLFVCPFAASKVPTYNRTFTVAAEPGLWSGAKGSCLLFPTYLKAWNRACCSRR